MVFFSLACIGMHRFRVSFTDAYCFPQYQEKGCWRSLAPAFLATSPPSHILSFPMSKRWLTQSISSELDTGEVPFAFCSWGAGVSLFLSTKLPLLALFFLLQFSASAFQADHREGTLLRQGPRVLEQALGKPAALELVACLSTKNSALLPPWPSGIFKL